MPLTRKLGHLYLECPPTILFTVPELRKIHRHFFYAHFEKFFAVLRRSDLDVMTGDDQVKLEKIRQKCEVWQRICEATRFFRAALPNPDSTFKKCVYNELMSIEPKTVLHVVDHDTKYYAASFLGGESTKNVWNEFFRIWVNTYAGFPGTIATDQGSQLISDEWGTILAIHGIVKRSFGVKSRNTLGVGERYHAYLRQTYT